MTNNSGNHGLIKWLLLWLQGRHLSPFPFVHVINRLRYPVSSSLIPSDPPHCILFSSHSRLSRILMRLRFSYFPTGSILLHMLLLFFIPSFFSFVYAPADANHSWRKTFPVNIQEPSSPHISPHLSHNFRTADNFPSMTHRLCDIWNYFPPFRLNRSCAAVWMMKTETPPGKVRLHKYIWY